MKNRMIALAIVVLLYFENSAGFATDEFNEVALAPGDSQVVLFPKKVDLHLNKRDIIDLQWLNDQSWRITALRTGVVLIKGINEEGQEAVRTIVKVSPIQDETKSDQEDSLAKLCQTEHLKCGAEGRVVSGEVDHWATYLKAYGLCRRFETCTFSLLLSPRGLARFATDLEKILATNVEAERLSSGKLLVIVPCDRKALPETDKLIDSLTDGAESKNFLTVSCNRSLTDLAFKLTAKIFYVRDSDSEDLGVDWQKKITGSDEPKIKAFLEKNQNRVLSDPTIEIRLDQDIEIRSGGEVRIISQGENPAEHWRPTGIVMTARCGYIAGQQFSLRYALKLSLENKSVASQMNASMLSSVATLILGEGKVLGEINSVFNRDGQESVPILSAIPIIAPLFRYEFNGESQSKVYLWVKLEKA